jgi:low affinity Fe/Cu permease
VRASLPVGNTSATPQSAGWFGRLALATARLFGKPITFITAVLIVLIWAVTGPIFNYSDT